MAETDPPDENNIDELFNKQFGNSDAPKENNDQQNNQQNIVPQQNFQQQNFQQQQQNFQQYPNVNQPFNQYGGPLPAVPNAIASLVMGIIGIIFSIIWCWWITTGIGLILCIVALILGSSGVRAYNSNPSAYDPRSLGNAKAGKVMGLIGLIIAIIETLVSIIIILSLNNAFRGF